MLVSQHYWTSGTNVRSAPILFCVTTTIESSASVRVIREICSKTVSFLIDWIDLERWLVVGRPLRRSSHHRRVMMAEMTRLRTVPVCFVLCVKLPYMPFNFNRVCAPKKRRFEGRYRPTKNLRPAQPSFRKMSTDQSVKFSTLLLDMDGVLAEVSRSYRAAIEKTCHKYGATSVSQESITAAKIRGNANDDWKLSHALIMEHSTADNKDEVTLEQVTETFEEFYQGTSDVPGLYKLETLIPSLSTLHTLAQKSKAGVGIVTGRPRSDCLKFLRDHNLEQLVSFTYCMEDGPSKPDPMPVQKACAGLGVAPGPGVVLVGDTPDDIRAAVRAGCSGVGVVTPEGMAAAADGNYLETPLSKAMKEAGASVILKPGFDELVSMFS